MLLRNPDIIKSFREPSCKLCKSCSVWHRSCYSSNLIIIFCKLTYLIGKYIRICRFVRFFEQFTRLYIKWCNSVEFTWISLCRPVPVPFLCYNMDKDRFVNSFRYSEDFYKLINIMSIYRTKIRNPHAFKHLSRKNYLFQITLFLFN